MPSLRVPARPATPFKLGPTIRIPLAVSWHVLHPPAPVNNCWPRAGLPSPGAALTTVFPVEPEAGTVVAAAAAWIDVGSAVGVPAIMVAHSATLVGSIVGLGVGVPNSCQIRT